jgi:carbon monoxide dehydrogenase subunit G
MLIMAKIERTIVINAPIEEVFKYLTDPMHQLDTISNLTEVKNIKGQGVGQQWSWAYKLTGMSFKGESIVTEYEPNKRYVTQSKGGIKSTWTYTFEPSGTGTRLSLVLEYTIPVPVVGKVGERLVLRQNEREADLAMANIRDRIENRNS